MWASEGWSEKTSQSRGSHLQHLWSSTDSLCVDGIYTESLYIKQHIKEVYRLGRKRQSTGQHKFKYQNIMRHHHIATSMKQW